MCADIPSTRSQTCHRHVPMYSSLSNSKIAGCNGEFEIPLIFVCHTVRRSYRRPPCGLVATYAAGFDGRRATVTPDKSRVSVRLWSALSSRSWLSIQHANVTSFRQGFWMEERRAEARSNRTRQEKTRKDTRGDEKTKHKKSKRYFPNDFFKFMLRII